MLTSFSDEKTKATPTLAEKNVVADPFLKKIKKAFHLYNKKNSTIDLQQFNPSRDGVLDLIVLALKEKRFQDIEVLYGLFLGRGVFELPHPENPSIKTRAVSSVSMGSEHYIIFSDKNAENPWIYMQRIYAVDAVILPSKIYYVMQSSYGLSAKDNMKSVLLALDDIGLYSYKDARLDGLIIGHSRPHHFFYDQLRVLNSLVEKNYLVRSSNVFVGDHFFNVKSVFSECTDAKEGKKVFLRPNIYNAIGIPPGKNSWSKTTMESLEKKVYEYAISQKKKSILPQNHLKIWIGITGQKRSWIEQIEGYASIINHFSLNGTEVSVVIDGMTAAYQTKIECPEDQYVADKIIQLLDPRVQIFNLIGCDYLEKIQTCDEVDFFVANGGTGCMVPLRFCKKPGVIHSNTKLSFPFDDVYSRVIVVNQPEYVTDQTLGSDREQAMTVSYHIQWQHIFNSLLDVFPIDKKNGAFKRLPLDSNIHFKYIDTITAFKKTANRLVSEKIIANPSRLLHILRELAVAFDSMKLHDVAYELIMLALSKNYSNEVLKDLALDYKAKIGTSELDVNSDKDFLLLATENLQSKNIQVTSDSLPMVMQIIAEGVESIGRLDIADKIKETGELFKIRT